MIQDQLVEYISSQMKIGVSRDAIKNTLTAAGWQAVDIEDTLKKVEAAKTSQPITAPATAATMPAKPSTMGGPVGGVAKSDPTMKMSDLISGVDPMGGIKGASTGQPASTSQPQAQPQPVASKNSVIGSPMTSFAATQGSGKSSKGSMILTIVLVVLVVAAGGLAGYFYFQNSQLSAKISSLSSTSNQLSAQVNSATQQVTASTTDLQAQITQLTANNQSLRTELSFYAVSPSSTQGAPASATISGMLSGGGKNLFLITTANGSKIYVVNSKEAKAVTALTPLVGTSTVQFSGTYISGSDSMTVVSVNGTSL